MIRVKMIRVRMIRVRMIRVTEEQERQCIGHGHDRWWCCHWSKAYSFNREKPGWSVSSVGAHPDTRPSQSQANSGKAGQSWANSGKVGQSWARLGKVGQSRANRNVVTVAWKPRRAFDFCPVIVTSLTGAGKCYLLHTQIRRIMPSAADNHIMPSRPVHKNLFLEFPKYLGRFMLHFDI